MANGDVLFQNQTVTGVSGTSVDTPIINNGGFINRTIYIDGTFGGCTVSIEVYLAVINAWVELTATKVTAKAQISLSFRADKYRAKVAGGTSINITVVAY